MWVVGADASTLAAVDRDADKVSLRELPRCCARCGRIRGLGFVPLVRTEAKDLGHVAVWTCPGVFEDDIRERHSAKVTAGARVRHPWRGGIFGLSGEWVRRHHVRQRVGRWTPRVVNEVGPVL